MNLRVVLMAAALTLAAVALVTYKVVALGYELVPRATEDRWAVQMQLRLEGEGEKARVRFYLPVDRPEQQIYDERVLGEGMKLYIRPRGANRVGYLTSRLTGLNTVSYRFSVHIAPRDDALPSLEDIRQRAEASPPDPRYLGATDRIQVDDRRVRQRLEEITPPGADDLQILRSIYDYLADEVPGLGFGRRSDALSVLQRERGGPLGKARLFVALARAAGIPARVAGGFDLENGAEADTTWWGEALLAGRWIPFDPVSRHFGTLPDNRLVLFEGDRGLVSARGVDHWTMRVSALKEEVSSRRLYERRVQQSDAFLDRVSLYTLPVRTQLTLRILLLIPFGALMVAFFRNVVGTPTFGTFMPVLVALAFTQTGLVPGVVLLLTILALGWGFRAYLNRLQLLMIPRLSLLLTVVVFVILAISLISEKLGRSAGLNASFFPLVILTMTIERFSIMVEEEGTRNALKATVGTLVTALAAYLLLVSDVLQRMILAFPELLFVVMAVLLLLGRYTGYRLSEYLRFAAFRTSGSASGGGSAA